MKSRYLHDNVIDYIIAKLFNMEYVNLSFLELDLDKIRKDLIAVEYYRYEEWGFNPRVSYRIYFKDVHIVDIVNVEEYYLNPFTYKDYDDIDENVDTIHLDEYYGREFNIINKPNFKDFFYYLIDNSKYNEH